MLRSAPPRTGGLAAWAGWCLVACNACYGIVLVIGLAALPSPDAPVADPWFTAMELLIIIAMLPMVMWVAAIGVAAEGDDKALAMTGLVFAGLLAGLTSVVHFAILVLTRQPVFAADPWLPQVLAFRWPSVAYVLDILAWDVLFPAMAFCLAPTFRGAGRNRAVRWLLLVSGGLALAGLSGVPTGNMGLRNIGIVGYALVFPLAVACSGWPLRHQRQPGASP